MAPLALIFSFPHLKAAIYFNFQNMDVKGWKTGKAKWAESSPGCV